MSDDKKLNWIIFSFLTIFPFTAILHHAVFWRPTCMLNPFGEDYFPKVIAQWLSRDPSLPWAILLAAFVYYFGKKWYVIKVMVYSFLPSVNTLDMGYSIYWQNNM